MKSTIRYILSSAALLIFLIIQSSFGINADKTSTSISKETKLSEVKSDEDFVGTWELVSIRNSYPVGYELYHYGKHPKGMLITDKEGGYSLQILKALRPNIVAGNKNIGTAEEYEISVNGSNSHFGKYAVDGSTKTTQGGQSLVAEVTWNKIN